jgi:alpha-L-rhamnosidase
MKRAALLFLSALVLWSAASVRPQQLRCEYRVNPQGIDVPDPRLSWLLAPVNPAARGLSQSVYRVLVASTQAALRANSGDLWDTGRIASRESP